MTAGAVTIQSADASHAGRPHALIAANLDEGRMVTDCVRCPRFRQWGQYAMVVSLA